MDAQSIINLVTKNASAISALSSTDSKLESVIKLIKANSSSKTGGLAGAIGALGGLLGKNKGNDISSLVITALTLLQGKDLNSSNISSIVSAALKGNSSANSVVTTILNMIKK